MTNKYFVALACIFTFFSLTLNTYANQLNQNTEDSIMAFDGSFVRGQENQRKAISNSNIIIIPDSNHGDKTMLERELEVIEKIKRIDDSFNCLFLEVGTQATASIADFINGQSYESTVEAWSKQSVKDAGLKSFLNIIPDWYLLRAHKLNLKMFGVDVDWKSEVGKKILPAIHTLIKSKDPQVLKKIAPMVDGVRNEFMSQNIVRHLQSKICKKGILVVGNGHLADIAGGKYKSLPTYLTNAKLRGLLYP